MYQVLLKIFGWKVANGVFIYTPIVNYWCKGWLINNNKYTLHKRTSKERLLATLSTPLNQPLTYIGSCQAK